MPRGSVVASYVNTYGSVVVPGGGRDSRGGNLGSVLGLVREGVKILEYTRSYLGIHRFCKRVMTFFLV